MTVVVAADKANPENSLTLEWQINVEFQNKRRRYVSFLKFQEVLGYELTNILGVLISEGTFNYIPPHSPYIE